MHSKKPLCATVLSEHSQKGLRPQRPMSCLIKWCFFTGDTEILLPLIKANGDRADPLIFVYIKLFLLRGWEVNLKLVAELIELGYNVNN